MQPIVAYRIGPDGRYRIRFGAKRLRAAKMAGLAQIPVVIGSKDHDTSNDQVAEDQKRHGLSPLGASTSAGSIYRCARSEWP
jgi:ParB family chromosome partitioning protein